MPYHYSILGLTVAHLIQSFRLAFAVTSITRTPVSQCVAADLY